MSSWFGGGKPAEPAGPTPMEAAKTEMEMYTDLFNKMSDLCFRKCVQKMTGDSDLSIGEMSCVDRCVGKYMESQEKVGAVLNQFEQNMKAQAAQSQGMMGGAARGPSLGSK